MAIETDIEWADSTLNLQMGCDGCELWNPKKGVRRCYAGILTERYGGKNPGFPASFGEPKLFLHRLDAALRWPDLTGTERPDKPWLNGLPRVIFLDDMGDTFTESLPRDWLAPLLPRIAESPHIYMLLTKRARRLLEFAEEHELPPNVWPGVSVTTNRRLARVDTLLQVRGGGRKWVSAEPLWEGVKFEPFQLSPKCPTCLLPNVNGGDACSACGERMNKLRLVILGGESGGRDAKPCDVAWIRGLLKQCRDAGIAAFVKQLGREIQIRNDSHNEWPHEGDDLLDPYDHQPRFQGEACIVRTVDAKGGDPSEWPLDVRVRQFPRTESVPHAGTNA